MNKEHIPTYGLFKQLHEMIDEYIRMHFNKPVDIKVTTGYKHEPQGVSNVERQVWQYPIEPGSNTYVELRFMTTDVVTNKLFSATLYFVHKDENGRYVKNFLPDITVTTTMRPKKKYEIARQELFILLSCFRENKTTTKDLKYVDILNEVK